MKGYLSIQEFSKISGVGISTLRYWDDNGVFSPIRRDPENNYRCYSLEQIVALNFVTTLSDLGTSLKTIAELRKTRNAKSLLDLLYIESLEMEKELRSFRDRMAILQSRQGLIRHGLEANENEISVIYTGRDRAIFLWPANEYFDDDTFLEPLSSHINQIANSRINLGFPIGGRYDGIDKFIEHPGRPQNFFSIDPAGTSVCKKGDYLVGYTRGCYGDFGDFPQRIMAYIKDNNIRTSGPVYVTYPLDEICIQDPNNYLAQIMVAVAKPRRR